MTNVKMRSTVFYSWQSDSDNKVNRNFIQDALKKAIKQLKRNEDVLSAMRDDSSIELDKDTLGIPGSPPVVLILFSKNISSRCSWAILRWLRVSGVM